MKKLKENKRQIYQRHEDSQEYYEGFGQVDKSGSKAPVHPPTP